MDYEYIAKLNTKQGFVGLINGLPKYDLSYQDNELAEEAEIEKRDNFAGYDENGYPLFN